jgi:hypothetical protein
MEEIGQEAYTKLILHSAKYPNLPVQGILIGSALNSKITDAIPLFHQPLLTTPSLQMALEMISLSIKNSKKFIVGLYFGNDSVSDESIPSIVELLADKIDLELGGDAILIKLDPKKIYTPSYGILAYKKQKVWTKCELKVINDNVKLRQMMENDVYLGVQDYEAYLNDVSIDWIGNSQLEL